MEKDADGTDELQFGNGKLYSVGCADWGFDWCTYSTKVEGNSIGMAIALDPSADRGLTVFKPKAPQINSPAFLFT